MKIGQAFLGLGPYLQLVLEDSASVVTEAGY